MHSIAYRACRVGVLGITLLVILALCFGALSLGFRGDAPSFVQLVMAGLGVLILLTAVVAFWCRMSKNR